MNCILYSDDVVSEKYHNNGSLTMLTSLVLSVISNIVASLFTIFISHLTDYSEILEAIITDVKNKKKYFENILRFMKYIKIRLSFFYILEMVLILFMTYYLFIFSAVYHQSQTSIVINYLIGASISLATSLGLTIIISVLRLISLKYHSLKIYNTSRYLYKTF